MDGPATGCFGTQRIFADLRLDRRLGAVFNAMARHPQGTLPQKLVGRGPLVGGYRMLNNPKVSHQAIIHSHRERCLERLRGYQGKVLLLHDTTVLDYSGLGVEGLGQVGGGHGRGLYAHHSLAVIPATRAVVGLMNQVLHVRACVPRGESKKARQARTNRESRLWTQGIADLPVMPPGVVVTDVSDRGSDITEYLAYAVRCGRTFIVRSQHNRKLADGAEDDDPQRQKLHDRLGALPAMDAYTLRVPNAAGGWRVARMALAWAPVEILPPRQARGVHGPEPLALWGVMAREVAAPQGQEPLAWVLLTNRPVASAPQARAVVEDYACRWIIEDYHKAQKTGCGIQTLQMTTRHGLDNGIALLSVLAVHVLRLRCHARDEQTRQQPACRHEEPLKVQLAARAARCAHWQTMTVWEFYLAVARLGGYVCNPRKRPPGWIILWRGYMRLEEMCQGVRLIRKRCVQT